MKPILKKVLINMKYLGVLRGEVQQVFIDDLEQSNY